jgi:hypothetical protein
MRLGYQVQFGSLDRYIRSRLHAIRTPVLLIHGRQDAVAEGGVSEAHRLIRTSKLVLLNECGHMPWAEHQISCGAPFTASWVRSDPFQAFGYMLRAGNAQSGNNPEIIASVFPHWPVCHKRYPNSLGVQAYSPPDLYLASGVPINAYDFAVRTKTSAASPSCACG